MSSGIDYAIGAMLFFGIGDMIYKRAATAGLAAHHLLMAQSWVFLPSVTLYGLLTGTLRFGVATWWGALAGVFMTVGFYNFAHSLRSGSISINAPIFRLSFVVTTIFAILVLGEPAMLYKVFGIAFALAAVWLLLRAPSGAAGSARSENLESLARVLVATLSVGIGNVLYKYGLRGGATAASLIVAQAMVVVTFSTVFVAIRERRIRPSRIALRYAPVAAVVLAIGFALMVESLARGEASVVVPIAQMGFGVTAVLGFLFLGEPFTARKGVGLAAALAALTSFAYGQSPL